MRNPWMAIWLNTFSTTMSATRAFWASVLHPQHGEAPDAKNREAPRREGRTEDPAKPEESKPTLEPRRAAARSGAAKPTRSEKPAAGGAKYRHPDDPDLTWSGRGRRPRWLTEALDAGHDLDDMKVAKR